jgi:general secretion pathway protein K
MILTRKHRRSGVAILTAVVTIAIMVTIVTEVTYLSRSKSLTAYNQRNQVQAYWIARSGINIYTLILAANKQIGSNSTIQDLGLGDSLWQMIPYLNTGLMRMLFASESGGDVSDEAVDQFKEEGTINQEVSELTREGAGSVFNDRNFLDFEGDFAAELMDNESRIDINQLNTDLPLQEIPVAQQIFALMNSEEADQWFLEQNIDRWEMIGNVKDWVDSDSIRSAGLGGYEDNLYNTLDPPYLTKNAPFDTLEEIRLVEGWSGELCDKYCDRLTIWSNGKYNLNSFDEEMHRATIRAASLSPINDSTLDACFAGNNDSILSVWDVAVFNNANDYVSFIKSNCGIELEKSRLSNMTSTSQVFTITSTGMVGTSSVTLQTVIDYSTKNTGSVKYWRIE